MRFQLRISGISILDCVVQECGLQYVEIVDVADLDEDCRYFDWVMYIRNLSLAFTHLPFVLPGRKTSRTAQDSLVRAHGMSPSKTRCY